MSVSILLLSSSLDLCDNCQQHRLPLHWFTPLSPLWSTLAMLLFPDSYLENTVCSKCICCLSDQWHPKVCHVSTYIWDTTMVTKNQHIEYEIPILMRNFFLVGVFHFITNLWVSSPFLFLIADPFNQMLMVSLPSLVRASLSTTQHRSSAIVSPAIWNISLPSF